MARNLGSKAASGAYQQIINLMPPHDCYIEAFLGGGTVMKRKAPAIRSFGLDLDERCLNVGDYDDGYTELVGHWWQHSFRSQTRGGVRIEKVWCNFEPGEMHYHTYTGNNASERQRIKRKADRMAKKIRSLPDAERQAVVAAILIALNES
ncbi:hypothetical protein KW507_15995 [Vibrio fluvialis]|nr:hypothetical protein [Vibrio fluvialis]